MGHGTAILIAQLPHLYLSTCSNDKIESSSILALTFNLFATTICLARHALGLGPFAPTEELGFCDASMGTQTYARLSGGSMEDEGSGLDTSMAKWASERRRRLYSRASGAPTPTPWSSDSNATSQRRCRGEPHHLDTAEGLSGIWRRPKHPHGASAMMIRLALCTHEVKYRAGPSSSTVVIFWST